MISLGFLSRFRAEAAEGHLCTGCSAPALVGAAVPPTAGSPTVTPSADSNRALCLTLLIKAELSNHSRDWRGSLEPSPANALPWPRPMAGNEAEFSPWTWEEDVERRTWEEATLGAPWS